MNVSDKLKAALDAAYEIYAALVDTADTEFATARARAHADADAESGYKAAHRAAYAARAKAHIEARVAYIDAAYDIAVAAYAVAIDARAKARAAAPDGFYAADRVARKTARAARAARAKAHDAYAVITGYNQDTAVRTHPDILTTEHYNYDVAYAAARDKAFAVWLVVSDVSDKANTAYSKALAALETASGAVAWNAASNDFYATSDAKKAANEIREVAGDAAEDYGYFDEVNEDLDEEDDLDKDEDYRYLCEDEDDAG